MDNGTNNGDPLAWFQQKVRRKGTIFKMKRQAVCVWAFYRLHLQVALLLQRFSIILNLPGYIFIIQTVINSVSNTLYVIHGQKCFLRKLLQCF